MIVAVITRLILARHGEAHCNVAGLAGGEKTCTGLTARGRTQAGQLAARLRGEHQADPVDVLYSAPRRRVMETTQILSAGLGIPVHVEPGLNGPRHGEGDGQPWDQIKAEFGGPPRSEPGRPYARGSETWTEYLERAGHVIGGLVRRHHGQSILIVGHAETVEAAATLLLGLSEGACTRIGFETSHASLTRWHLHRNRFGHEVWMLSALNDTSHLRQC